MPLAFSGGSAGPRVVAVTLNLNCRSRRPPGRHRDGSAGVPPGSLTIGLSPGPDGAGEPAIGAVTVSISLPVPELRAQAIQCSTIAVMPVRSLSLSLIMTEARPGPSGPGT